MTHWQKTYPAWISFAAIAFLLAVWEIICSTGLISSLFLPAPSAILTALGKLITSGEISRSLTAVSYTHLTLPTIYSVYCTRQAYYKRRNQPQSDSQSLPHSAGLCFRQHHRFAGRARYRHLCADGPNRNTDRQCPLSDPKNRFTAAFYSLAWNR